MQVPITRPWFDEEDFALIRQPLENGWVAQGPFVAEFERRFCDYTGAAHAVACTSATTGLHLALAARGVGPGDEVVVPAFTWVATANAALYQGATVVLCDVDPVTFNLDPEDLARRITPRTRAVVPVHLFGLPAPLDPVRALAATRSLVVVEDAACGLGARIGATHVGRFGDCGVFSFHPRKAITTGEGGMITTEDADLAATLRRLRNHGAGQGPPPPPDRPTPAFLLADYAELGFNYRMTDLQAALGVAQMSKVRAIEAHRGRLAARYHHLLADFAWLRRPEVPAGQTHGWQSYVVRFEPEAPTLHNRERLVAWRDRLMVALEDAGVSTRPGTHAVSGLTLYRHRLGIDPTDYPGALLAEGLSLALPLFPTLTEPEQDFVVDRLHHIFVGLKPPR